MRSGGRKHRSFRLSEGDTWHDRAMQGRAQLPCLARRWSAVNTVIGAGFVAIIVLHLALKAFSTTRGAPDTLLLLAFGMLMLMGVYPLWWETRVARRVRARGMRLCPWCLYDLRGLGGAGVGSEPGSDTCLPCPECGSWVHLEQTERLWREFVVSPTAVQRAMRWVPGSPWVTRKEQE